MSSDSVNNRMSIKSRQDTLVEEASNESSEDDDEIVEDEEFYNSGLNSQRSDRFKRKITRIIKSSDPTDLINYFNKRNLNALNGLLSIECEAVNFICLGIISIFMEILPKINRMTINDYKMGKIDKKEIQRMLKVIINGYNKIDLTEIYHRKDFS